MFCDGDLSVLQTFLDTNETQPSPQQFGCLSGLLFGTLARLPPSLLKPGFRLLERLVVHSREDLKLPEWTWEPADKPLRDLMQAKIQKLNTPEALRVRAILKNTKDAMDRMNCDSK